MNRSLPVNWRVVYAFTLLLFVLQACSCSDDSVKPTPPPESPQRCEWFWQNPLPTGNQLLSVSFVDENTGTVVGLHGTILRTTNCGTK